MGEAATGPRARIRKMEGLYRRGTAFVVGGVLLSVAVVASAVLDPGEAGIAIGPLIGVAAMPLLFGFIFGLGNRAKARRNIAEAQRELARLEERRPYGAAPHLPALEQSEQLSPRQLIDLLEELERVAWSGGGEQARLRIGKLRERIDRAVERDEATRARAAAIKAQIDAGDIDDVVAVLQDFHNPPPHDEALETQPQFVPPMLGLAAAIGLGVGLVSGSRAGETGATAVLALLALALFGFFALWFARRKRQERRVLLAADDVWLPAAGFSLTGRRIPYSGIDAVELVGPGIPRLRIRTRGGRINYYRDFVDVEELHEKLLERMARDSHVAARQGTGRSLA